MIGVEGLSRSLEGGKADGYRVGAVECMVDASDSFRASAVGEPEWPHRGSDECLEEPAKRYGYLALPSGSGSRSALDESVTRLGGFDSVLRK